MADQLLVIDGLKEFAGKNDSPDGSSQFVAFLTDVVCSQVKSREIPVICDNVSSHKTDAVRTFLDAHKNVAIHFTRRRIRRGSAVFSAAP